MKFRVDVEGGEELAQALRALSTRASRAVQIEALLDGGELIRKRVARTMPRAAGAPDIANEVNIKAVRRRVGDHPMDVSVGIGVPKEFYYDWFLEYGTVRMGARPTWRPAFDTLAPEALGVIGRAMWTALAAKGIGRTVDAPATIQSLGGLL